MYNIPQVVWERRKNKEWCSLIKNLLWTHKTEPVPPWVEFGVDVYGIFLTLGYSGESAAAAIRFLQPDLELMVSKELPQTPLVFRIMDGRYLNIFGKSEILDLQTGNVVTPEKGWIPTLSIAMNLSHLWKQLEP